MGRTSANVSSFSFAKTASKRAPGPDRGSSARPQNSGNPDHWVRAHASRRAAHQIRGSRGSPLRCRSVFLVMRSNPPTRSSIAAACRACHRAYRRPRLYSRPHAQARVRTSPKDMRFAQLPNRETSAEPMHSYVGADARKHAAQVMARQREDEITFARQASRISIARSQSGTRCTRPPFMRAAGTVHMRAARSISDHFAPNTSPDRAALRMQNSSAQAPMPCASRNCARNDGQSV